MFFSAAKIFWIVAKPVNLALLLWCLAVLLLWSRWRRLGRWLASLVTVVLLAVAVLPVGGWLMLPLEHRFPPFTDDAAADPVTGIILLSGAVVDLKVSQTLGHAIPGKAAGRLAEFVRLAEAHPEARLLICGGSGSLRAGQDPRWEREAPLIADYLVAQGYPRERLLVEDRSRDTFENARYGKDMAQPKDGERWLLVTSAWHMPRAMAVFRARDWLVEAAPAAPSTSASVGLSLRFNLGSGLSHVNTAMYEYLGLLAYWLQGRTNTLWATP